jgi:hypothetical protein
MGEKKRPSQEQIEAGKARAAKIAARARAKPTRMNIYLPRPGILTLYKMFAVMESDRQGRTVRVNELAVEALTAYIEERMDFSSTDGDSAFIRNVLDSMELMHPTHPDAEKIDPSDMPKMEDIEEDPMEA